MDNKTFYGTLTLAVVAIILVAAGVGLWWMQHPGARTAVNNSNATTTSTPATNSPSTNSAPTKPTNSTNANQNTSTTTESPCPDAGLCKEDAKTFCPDELAGTDIKASWKLDLVNCLYDEHKNDISAECRESLECRQQLNEELVAACKSDTQKFCSSTRPSPGSEPLVDCLEAHFSDLTAACAEAWTRHDAAKPN